MKFRFLNHETHEGHEKKRGMRMCLAWLVSGLIRWCRGGIIPGRLVKSHNFKRDVLSRPSESTLRRTLMSSCSHKFPPVSAKQVPPRMYISEGGHLEKAAVDMADIHTHSEKILVVIRVLG
jgi:hypothetical protein